MYFFAASPLPVTLETMVSRPAAGGIARSMTFQPNSAGRSEPGPPTEPGPPIPIPPDPMPEPGSPVPPLPDPLPTPPDPDSERPVA